MKLKEQYKTHQEIFNKGFRFDPEEETFFTSDKKKFFYPEDENYKDWKIQEFDKNKYLDERLKELGLEASPKLELIDKENIRFESEIFTANKFGDIEILQYNLKREISTYNDETKTSGVRETKEKYNVQKRLNPIYENICAGKYDFSEAKNTPFWHPDLIRMYETKEVQEIVYITEGQFKAFKASQDGIPTIGFTSISHFKDKKFNTIHPEVIDFLKAVQAKKVVILWDGDCRDVSTKAIKDQIDLADRPGMFYFFANKIAELIYDFYPIKKQMQIYFGTIRTADLDKEPKGIDDLLISHKAHQKQIVSDFLEVGEMPSKYIEWINISNDDGKKKMRKYFNLHSVVSFYGFHQDKIKGSNFIFQGSNYRVEKNLPIIEIPKDLKTYKRIGVDYYQLQMKPVAKSGISTIDRMFEEVLAPWSLPAIKSDHGKDADRHVERYKGFTNEASHVEYQQVVEGYWNLYANIQHEPQKGEFPHIAMLLKHLFDEHYDNEMILDYFSVLYRFPWQKLPVVCLVSKLQSTGKSTFIYLMKLVFKQNMAIISNNDLVGDFNSHWTSKLVVASEETLLEKADGYEKIKSLSTAKEIMRNEKNKTAASIPCMVHFVFCSNHEDNFIKIDDYDSRLWIRKVKSITQNIKKFDQKIEDEIPYFVDFIMTREIKYEDVGERLYFHPRDFRTDAFENVVKNSQPSIIKNLKIEIEEYFLKNESEHQLNIDSKNLKMYFGVKCDDYYLSQILKEYLKAEKSKNSSTFSFVFNNPTKAGEAEKISGKGRYFTFMRSDFLEE